MRYAKRSISLPESFLQLVAEISHPLAASCKQRILRNRWMRHTRIDFVDTVGGQLGAWSSLGRYNAPFVVTLTPSVSHFFAYTRPSSLRQSTTLLLDRG